ncbi:hypothetical protein LshimejAT787_0310870 [Lyophyllum shimeji]|uniref:Uncharacterized protein n=1 Tax=Lyophyllum shimeji TaxID=47721 RepID=A0A9P3PIY0_LYOSH|nr:hypothetical protein LshimejAT787_0310870 [Lyophyllum shimeji]
MFVLRIAELLTAASTSRTVDSVGFPQFAGMYTHGCKYGGDRPNDQKRTVEPGTQDYPSPHLPYTVSQAIHSLVRHFDLHFPVLVDVIVLLAEKTHRAHGLIKSPWDISVGVERLSETGEITHTNSGADERGGNTLRLSLKPGTSGADPDNISGAVQIAQLELRRDVREARRAGALKELEGCGGLGRPVAEAGRAVLGPSAGGGHRLWVSEELGASWACLSTREGLVWK